MTTSSSCSLAAEKDLQVHGRAVAVVVLLLCVSVLGTLLTLCSPVQMMWATWAGMISVGPHSSAV
jgi:hypothetical protein